MAVDDGQPRCRARGGDSTSGRTRASGHGHPRPETRATLADAGASRVFVLRLGRLDRRCSSPWRSSPRPRPLRLRRPAASSLDEADTVVPRLSARCSTASRSSERAHADGHGAGVGAAAPQARRGALRRGLGLEPLGGSLGWCYETRRWRLGVLAQGADEGASFLGIDGAWLPYDGNVSPYLGAGLGIVGQGDDGTETVPPWARSRAGVGFFRLHRVRLMAGVSAIIPFESVSGVDDVSWGLHRRCGSDQPQLPPARGAVRSGRDRDPPPARPAARGRRRGGGAEAVRRAGHPGPGRVGARLRAATAGAAARPAALGRPPDRQGRLRRRRLRAERRGASDAEPRVRAPAGLEDVRGFRGRLHRAARGAPGGPPAPRAQGQDAAGAPGRAGSAGRDDRVRDAQPVDASGGFLVARRDRGSSE